MKHAVLIFQKSLNGFAVMYIHKDSKLTAKEVLVELFKTKRKLDFV